MTTFGNRIRRIRIAHELKQSDLADIFNVTQTAISKIESGQREPSLSFIIAFCQHFAVSADFLLGLSDQAPQATVQQDPFADLTPDQRTVINITLAAFRSQNAASKKEA